jgi:transcriptional regulator with XRE-family HTH domain
MGRNIQDIIKTLPRDRRERIKTNAQRMALEMIQHADSLEQLRKAAGKTQTEVAQKLGIKQHAISQLENRADLYLSTLNKYVGALGHRLELALVTATGERVQLTHFHPWERSELLIAVPRASKKRSSSAEPKVASKVAKPRVARQQNAVAAEGEGQPRSGKSTYGATRRQSRSPSAR